ncbi:MAG: patatin-like phospholipase family protein [Spirochaetia bacterium]|nr:patatin-like phospholipase family protein [Spirochaetia bacterium]
MGSKNTPYRISLNLGGGGARGLAHIGVLRALEENEIEFDILIGVSMGALIAANYAYYKSAGKVQNLIANHIESADFKKSLLGTWRPAESDAQSSRSRRLMMKFSRLYKQTEIYGRLFLSTGMLDKDDIIEAVYPIIPNIDFDELNMPFSCIAVNLENGNRRIFNQGSVRTAVLASLSMPLVFPPVEINGNLYTDGGIVDRVGVDSAFDIGVKKIIAVDVSNDFFAKKKIKTALDIMLRSEEISAKYRKNYQLKQAAIIIRPIQDSIHWADYHNYKNIIQAGYESTIEKIKEIKRLVRTQKSILRYFVE